MRRIALALVLVVVAAAAPAARANHWWWCGGTWTGPSAGCGFAVRGTPLMVRGEASAAGRARVEVRIITVIQGNEVVLFGCEDEAPRVASCTADMQEHTVDALIGTVPLTCHVRGTAGGTFRCGSVDFREA